MWAVKRYLLFFDELTKIEFIYINKINRVFIPHIIEPSKLGYDLGGWLRTFQAMDGRNEGINIVVF